MKKPLIYILILFAGIFLGIMAMKIFPSSSESATSEEVSTSETIWTCSMHPEIQQNEPGTCPICGMDLTPMEDVDDNVDSNLFSLTERALALADIQTEVIQAEQLSSGVKSYTGRIQTTDASTQIQSAYVSGRIEKLYVNTTGAAVSRGQVLAEIYSPELLSAQQELLSAYKRKDQNPNLYRAIRNRLLQWKWSEEQIENLIQSGQPQPNFSIRAMVSGEVIEKKVSEGSYVTAGQELFSISDLSKLWAVIDLPESQAHQIKEGDSIELSTSSKANIKAKVSMVLPLIEQSTRSVQVRIELSNTDRKLKPGMLVKADIQTTADSDSGIFIPKSAVMWTGKRSVVYVVHRDHGQLHFEMREVELGTAQSGQYEILEGLDFDEEIVTYGAFTIDAAAQLQGKGSMISRKRNKVIELSEHDQEELMIFMKEYYLLKDVFVTSDAEEVAKQASESLEIIEELSLHSEDSAEEKWQHILHQWHQIAHSEKDIEKQRKSFKSLNENLIPLAKNINIHEETWYLQECPMADQDTGAYWISLEKHVINPYFGERMLKCGSVEEEWN